MESAVIRILTVHTQADAGCRCYLGKWDLRHTELLVILPDFLPPTAGR